MVNYGGSGGLQPYQFSVDAAVYGAKGDGKLIGDATIAGGALSTLTSASAGFTSADTGKHIMINGANGTAAPLITTITFVNSTTVTLGSAAGQAVTNTAAVYGTDDTAAINAAITAAKTYATAAGTAAGSGNYFAEVVFGPKYYILSAAPTQTSGAGGVINAQIPVPYPAVANTGQKLVISLRGSGDAGQAQFWLSTVPNLQGTCLVSMQTAPSTPDPTFGRQSVVGGPSAGGAFGGGFANVKPVVQNISVWCPIFTNMIGWDFRYCAGLHMDACSAQAFAPANAGVHPFLSDLPASVAFQSTISRGLAAPLITNNDDITIPSFTAQGFEVGAWLQDHATVGRLVTVYVDAGVMIDVTESASNKSNMVTIANWSCEQYNGGLLSNAGAGGFLPVDITMTVETAGGANPTYDVSDSGGTLFGRVLWAGNGRTSNTPVVTGAAVLKVVNANLGPGHWAGAPGVPASGSAQQNTAWRDASIVVHTGAGVTVSAISVDGTATGLTMAASSSLTLPVLPAGKNVTLTYAGGTPTWDWWLA